MENKLKMFFLPAIMGISHIAPMLKAARMFASHPQVQVTIITPLQNVHIFQNDINIDRKAGHDIDLHIVKIPLAEVGLSDDIVLDEILSSTSLDNLGKLFRAVKMLSDPVLDLVRAQGADCLVSDLTTPWAADVASEANIPLINFNPSGLFGPCVDDGLTRFKPHENVSSDTEPFVVPGLPDKVVLTRSRLHDLFRGQTIGKEFRSSFTRAVDMSYCMIINSFDELEFKYVEYYKNVMGRKCCLVGPLLSYSGTEEFDHKDGKTILEWLDNRSENSVLYVSFGSFAPICKDQFHEIAHGLEASGRSFIWVARANLSGEQDDHGWFPEGFEDRVRDSNQGLVIKSWAPQEVILGHNSVGAFVTHCGWNSCLETLSRGVPVITWPLRMEQFHNESFMVDVLKVGIRVGNEEWTPQHGAELKVTVTREKLEAAVTRMMNNDAQEVVAMRELAKQFMDKSKVAIQKGGSSYRNMYALVEELKSLQKSSPVA